MKKYINITELKNKLLLIEIVNYDKYQIDVDKNHIKLHKKIVRNPIYKDSQALHLFIHCLIEAKPKDDSYPFNGNIFKLKRKQFITNCKTLSTDTGISHKTLKKKLDILSGKEDGKNANCDILLNNSSTSISIKSNNIRVDGDGKNAINLHHRETISYFCCNHIKTTGRKYHVQGAKDGTLVKKLLQTYSFEEIKEMMDAFFNAENWHNKEGEFVTGKAGYTIGVFYKTMGTTIAQMNKSTNTNKFTSKYAGLSK